MKKPNCFQGNADTCLGYSAYNDDEPIEQCKNCRWCEGKYEDDDESEGEG